MNDKEIRKEIIKLLLGNKNYLFTMQEICESINITEMVAEINLSFLESQKYIIGAHDIMGNSSYGCNKKSPSYLAIEDSIPAVPNINVSGNAIIAGGNISISNSIIADAVNNAGVPDALKKEINELLVYLAESSNPSSRKGNKALAFLAKVGDKFGNVAVSVSAQLIIKALTGILI